MRINILSSLVVLLLLAGAMLSTASCSREATPMPEPKIDFRKLSWGTTGQEESVIDLNSLLYERYIVEAIYAEEFRKRGFSAEVPQAFLLRDLELVLEACEEAEYRIYKLPHEFKASFVYQLGGDGASYYTVSFDHEFRQRWADEKWEKRFVDDGWVRD